MKRKYVFPLVLGIVLIVSMIVGVVCVYLLHDHVYKLTKSVEATCTKDGKEVYTCWCKENYSKKLTGGHTYKKGQCTRCGDIKNGKEEKVLYNWLVENGELKNGTNLSYTGKTETGATVSIYYNSLHTCKFWLEYVSEDINGYTFTFELPLIGEADKINVDAAFEKIFSTGSVGIEYSYKKSIISANSPLEDYAWKSFVGKEINNTVYDGLSGEIVPNPHLEEDIQKNREAKTKHDSIIAEIESFVGEGENIGGFIHQHCICALDWLNEVFCPLLGTTISDLGYKSY